MKIKDMIEQLKAAAEKVGMDCEVPVVNVGYGENDYIIPSYVVAGEFEDQNGTKYNVALVGSSGGSEFSRKDVPHYKWKACNDKVKA